MYNSIVSKLAIPEEDTSRQVYYDYLKDFLDSKNDDKDIDLNSVLPFIPGGVDLSNNEFKKEDDIEISKSKKESKLSFSFSSKDDFKNTMLPIYENVLLSKGLDPKFAKSLVAQDGLESAWGSKPSGDNNFGGIKGKGSEMITREVINGKDVYIKDSFRNFASLEDYAEHKVNLLNSKRYKAFDGGLEDFSRRVSAGGYATDPRYKEVLDKVIRNVRNGGSLKFQSGGQLQKDIDKGLNDNIEKLQYLTDVFRHYGATDEQIAAISGNIWKESSFNEFNKNINSGAYGLFQMLGERKKAYDHYLSKTGLEDSFKAQVDYMAPIIFGEGNPHGLDIKFKNGDGKYRVYDIGRNEWGKSRRDKFFNSKDLKGYTDSFATEFERPSDSELDLDTRNKASRYVLDLLMNYIK